MDEACKSSGIKALVIEPCESGERASNAWVSCPLIGDNAGKLALIPDVTVHRMVHL